MIEEVVLGIVNAHAMLSAPSGAACQAEGCPWVWPFPQDMKTVFDPASPVRLDHARHVTDALMAAILGQAEYGVAYRPKGTRAWAYMAGIPPTRERARQELADADPAVDVRLVWRSAAGPWQAVHGDHV